MNDKDKDKDKSCPICSIKMYHSERYPNMICNECSKKTTDDGEPISFYNIDSWGGFYSLVGKTKGNIH
jgi:hypothetical protein